MLDHKPKVMIVDKQRILGAAETRKEHVQVLSTSCLELRPCRSEAEVTVDALALTRCNSQTAQDEARDDKLSAPFDVLAGNWIVSHVD